MTSMVVKDQQETFSKRR